MDSIRRAVLCLCKDEVTLRVRRLLLEHFGYTVLSTSSVAQMHAMLLNKCPDMLLMDTNDPALDCKEVSGNAKAICPGLLAVVLTPEFGLPGSGRSGSVDRYLTIDGPREEWQSGIESLFNQQALDAQNMTNTEP